jgi:hypothetical protein
MAIEYTTTTNFALKKIKGSNKVSDIDDGIGALADQIDSTMVGFQSGTSLPAAGVKNRLFLKTDTKLWYLDTGSEWVNVARADQTVLLGGTIGAAGQKHLATGSATLTWTSTTGGSTGAIAHGLGKVPVYANAVLVGAEGGVTQSSIFANTFIIGIQDMDATNVTFGAQTVPGVTISPGPNTKVRWMAMG